MTKDNSKTFIIFRTIKRRWRHFRWFADLLRPSRGDMHCLSKAAQPQYSDLRTFFAVVVFTLPLKQQYNKHMLESKKISLTICSKTAQFHGNAPGFVGPEWRPSTLAEEKESPWMCPEGQTGRFGFGSRMVISNSLWQRERTRSFWFGAVYTVSGVLRCIAPRWIIWLNVLPLGIAISTYYIDFLYVMGKKRRIFMVSRSFWIAV